MTNQPELPGLEVPAAPTGSLTRSAIATLSALDAAGLLEARHALTCQLILDLAGAVDRGLGAERVTVATSTLSRQLLETIAALPVPVTAGSQWTDFQNRLAAVS